MQAGNQNRNRQWPVQIQCMDAFSLKCIAILSMLLDHTGAVLFPMEIWMRCLGRLAFPIFCFLIVEGFFHTHDIYRYMIRLGIFALLSEIPFDLAFQGVFLESEHQNVFFTLLIGIGMMHLLSRSQEWPVKAVILLLAMWLAVIVRSDYHFRGILLIFVFYIFRKSRLLSVAAGGCWNFLYQGTIQKFGILSMFPIVLYNGKRGKSMKYFFYVFYPAHLLILYGISRMTG